MDADFKNIEKYIERYISKRFTDMEFKNQHIKENSDLNKKIIGIDKHDLGSIKKDLVDLKQDLGMLNDEPKSVIYKLDGTNLKMEQLR